MRYAHQLPAVEINSSFYRAHRPATYARWALSVPPGFKFAVKMPREITHTRRLTDVSEPIGRFLDEVETLGPTLGPLLVQFPPSLQYDNLVAERFFATLRGRFSGHVACEPRHASWFEDDAEDQLSRFQVAAVAADPAIVPRAAKPGGWPGLQYWRLHGSPEIYRTGYGTERIESIARRMKLPPPRAQERWCIFDNTMLGEATGDALALLAQLRRSENGAGT